MRGDVPHINSTLEGGEYVFPACAGMFLVIFYDEFS